MLFSGCPAGSAARCRCKPAPTPKIEEPEACRQEQEHPGIGEAER